MSEAVLDASALLALIEDEPGADEVAATLPSAVVGAVNLSEIVAKLADRGMREALIRRALARLNLDIAAFAADDAYATGLLRPVTRELGLGLGDRACIALGQRLGLPVVTADRRWTELRLPVPVRAIR